MEGEEFREFRKLRVGEKDEQKKLEWEEKQLTEVKFCDICQEDRLFKRTCDKTAYSMIVTCSKKSCKYDQLKPPTEDKFDRIYR
jgi:hypothetical protein